LLAQEKSVEELTRAYRVLDVHTSASALAIKSNYRKLIKRWHPDRPATGVATEAEASFMTKLINEAYALIENAPLRYYSGTGTSKTAEKKHAGPKPRNINEVDLSKMFFNEKRIEYAVRITCGAISGAFVGLAFSLDFFREDLEIVAGIALCAIGFAAGAVKYGDRFWRAAFGNWWMWE
jgi:hypothetical protein